MTTNGPETPDPAEALAEAARGLVYQTDTRGPKVAMCVERIRRELAAFDAARPVRDAELDELNKFFWHVNGEMSAMLHGRPMPEKDELERLADLAEKHARRTDKLLAAREAQPAEQPEGLKDITGCDI